MDSSQNDIPAEHPDGLIAPSSGDVAGQRTQLELRVDSAALGELLMGRWAAVRRAARGFAGDPDLIRIPDQPMTEHRERVLKGLHALVARGTAKRAFPIHLGGDEDHGGNIAGFEELVLADPSLQIKAGVQWGLFGGAILHLGNDEHHRRWLPRIMNMDLPGAFAMTEIGHGSDVSSLGTTAEYDPASGEFVINTPFRAAWKEFLGNAARHGIAAVVFAKLITAGVDHGVHAFFVPIRDAETGALLPGVSSEDDGVKGGLNGIDNGRLAFDHVRVPRDNLLNRYGNVAADGTYSSPIASPGRRFFTMLGTLVQGRVSLDGAATVASKLALTIAIRYGLQRRQFKAADGSETVLLDYQRHQRRLLTRLATTYAMSFAHETLLQEFDDVFGDASSTDEDRQDLETLAAALKPLSTWNALDILQEAREACGGQGFMAANRLTELRADLDVYATFEGDNTVLLQLVAKRLLTDYARRLSKADAATIGKLVADQLGDAVIGKTGLRQFAQNVRDFGSTARSVDYVRDTDSQRQLLTDRVETLVAELAAAFKDANKLSADAAAALFNRHQNSLIAVARAHGELLQWEAFTDALDGEIDADTRQVLTWLRDLFGLGLIETNAAWYLTAGRLSAARARAITEYIDTRLLPRIRHYAADLIDAFELTPQLIRAPIALGGEQQRQDEAAAYYRQLAQSGEAPVPEERPIS